MAFSVPSFPLTCDIYSGPWLSRTFRTTEPCNLQVGRRGVVFADVEDPVRQVWNGPQYLLVGAGTDIRDLSQNIVDNDYVEVPSGSGRWYGVQMVEDVAKGFPNEFRYAVIVKISQNVAAVAFAGLFWPIPMP